jgi:hypothetical protein
MRDAFDDLLAYYSCVEIAALIGFVPSPLPRTFRAETGQILDNPDIRRYYRKHYPLLLPNMLLNRIRGRTNLKERSGDAATALFFEFLHISNLIEHDSSVDMLLWFLDSGYHRGYEWKDTLKTLRNPKRFIEALSRSPRSRTPAEQSVDGLRKFLGFCVAFKDLLDRSRQFPLLQSAMWHYHGYWFHIIRGEVRKGIEQALKEFGLWLSLPSAKKLPTAEITALKKEAAKSLQQVHFVVGRLTTSHYGSRLGRVSPRTMPLRLRWRRARRRARRA